MVRHATVQAQIRTACTASHGEKQVIRLAIPRYHLNDNFCVLTKEGCPEKSSTSHPTSSSFPFGKMDAQSFPHKD